MRFLQFLKSDYGIAGLCLLSIFLWKFLQESGCEWAEYAIWISLLFPAWVFGSQLLYAIRRTFFGYKKDE